MPGETNLDIVGASLRAPFPSFALVFSDRPTLQMAERLLADEEPCTHRGRLLRVMTVYVVEYDMEGERGLRLSFTFDDGSTDWPYLLSRDLVIDDDANLEAILASHHADVDPAKRDPIFESYPFKKLVQLVLNATLYATGAGPHRDEEPSATISKARLTSQSDVFTSEQVYFLPGHIDIMDARRLTRLQLSRSGRSYTHRFLVRGHWRRASPKWEDQTPRWIKPHWKGLDIAALIERSYRLKASEEGKTGCESG